MPKKKQTTQVDTQLDEQELLPSSNESIDSESFDAGEVAELLDTLPEGQLGDLHALALQVIRDALTGMKVLVHCTSAPQLLKGTAALWKVDTEDGGRYAYQYRPDIKLAQFVAQHAEGKPGTKEIAARATTVVFRACLPGKDEEINRYLAGLPDDILEKYKFDADTLKAIKAAKES